MDTPRQPPTAEEVNQRLRDQYAEIAALAGGLAHEIKNPLSTISLNMDLLAEDFAAADNPRERRALAKIAVVQRECQRLQDLLNDFLNFAKLRQLRLEPADLNAEVGRTLEFFRPQAEESRIEVVRYLDPDLPSVRLDREAFQGTLLNLILNAQQAMPEGGQLVARTRMSRGGVSLDLIDTGKGMDAKTVSQVFNTFFSTRPGGSGLGLPTARKIVEAHGGTIDVQSEPGRGTQFTIELPLPARLPGGANPLDGKVLQLDETGRATSVKPLRPAPSNPAPSKPGPLTSAPLNSTSSADSGD
jgi:signal transduction histidine kinase